MPTDHNTATRITGTGRGLPRHAALKFRKILNGGTFNVHELAASTAPYITLGNAREQWLHGGLERWLVNPGIARPNGTIGIGTMELTEYGAELIALLAELRD